MGGAVREDAVGRQIGIRDGAGYLTSRTYDEVGNIDTETDGNGNETEYAYDGRGLLLTVIYPTGDETSYTYDNVGNVLTQTDGNGNTVSYGYNNRNRMIWRADAGGVVNGMPVAGLTEYYDYYANGLIGSNTDKNGVTTYYTYDIHGRLTQENAGGEVASYTYDNNGNQLTAVNAEGTITRSYDAVGRVLTKNVAEFGTTSYTYDITGTGNGEPVILTKNGRGAFVVMSIEEYGKIVCHQANGKDYTE